MQAYLFPGQGAQFCGMGRSLYEGNRKAREMFERANELLGFRITDIMFGDDPEALKATAVTQRAVFLHSVILARCLPDFHPDMVAGHSLGEFSALASSGALSFENALELVSIRAHAMQKACDANPGAMAAVIGLGDEKVEEMCKQVSSGVVVAANYNCPGQVVISGEVAAIDEACVKMKEAGAKRALKLAVGGAFHSPLMEQARAELAAAIDKAPMLTPNCPIYQNIDAEPSTDPAVIKEKLLRQLTGPVLWTRTVRNMMDAGADCFTETGPGTVLGGLVKRIAGDTPLSILSITDLP